MTNESGRAVDLTSMYISLIKERNAVEVYPFKDVHDAYSTAIRENRELMQSNAEKRDQVSLLLHEFQEKFKGVYQVGYECEYQAIKGNIKTLSERFTNRRDSDIFQARMELATTIKKKNKNIEELTLEVESLRKSNISSETLIVNLRKEIESQQKVNQSISAELESVRALIAAAELKARKLENENASLISQFIREKEKMASEMNEMNNVVEGMKGFVGGGINFMKNIRSTVMPSLTKEVKTTSPVPRGSMTSHSVKDDDDDDFEVIEGSSVEISSEKSRMGSESSSISGGVESRSSRGNSIFGALVGGNSAAESKKSPQKEKEELGYKMLANYGPPRTTVFSERCHMTEINDIRCDGRFFVTAGADSTVKIFSLSTRELVYNLMSTGPSLTVDTVDSEWVISACAAGRSECRIWSMQTGRQRVNFGGHNNKIMCARFVGANRVVTASIDRTIKIWDISRNNTANPMQTITTNSSVESVAITPDTTSMASGHQDGGIRIWDMSTGEKTTLLPKVHSLHVTGLQYHPRDGNTLLTSSKDSSIKLLDCRSYEEIRVFKAPTFKLCSSRISFSPDGEMVAAGGTDGTIAVWSTLTGTIQTIIPGDELGHRANFVSSVDWSDAGLISADRSGVAVLWSS